MADREIANLPWAWFLGDNNELKLRAKTASEAGTSEAPDALMFRFQVPVDNLAGSGWIGCIAADILSGRDSDGPTERVQIKLGFVMDPDPQLRCVMTRLGGSNDADELEVFSFSLNGSRINGVQVGAAGGGGAPQGGRFFTSHENTHLMFQAQADPMSRGNLVVYDTKGTADESQWAAIGYHKMLAFPRSLKASAKQKAEKTPVRRRRTR